MSGSPRFELRSARDGAVLLFAPHDRDYFTVALRANGLDASVRVASYLSEGFAAFFGRLAAEWRGWEGVHEWSSLEGECILRARCDRAGHVTLTARMEYRQSAAWSVEGEVALEAGQLDAITAAAREFERNGIVSNRGVTMLGIGIGTGTRHVAALAGAALLLACSGAPTPGSERAAREVWDEYVASKEGRFAQHAGTPSPLWSASEQERWPMYDLAGFYLPDGAVPEVLSVTPVDAAVDSAYRIVTRFWPSGPAGAVTRGDSATPVLTMTVYARREGRRWMLANALPFATATWARERRGRIAYQVAPARRFDATKAERAAAFVDSIATAFGVPAPPRIDYYVAESVDQAMEVLGVVTSVRYGPHGGFAKPVNAQVFSGDPALGEEYRHELTHVLLLPVIRDGRTSLLASEGVPTWFGGTAGRDYAGSVRHLASRLAAQPSVDLDAIVHDMSLSPEIRNAAGAVLAEMVHEKGGVAAVREYLQTPGRAIPHALERLLAQPWETIAVEWRRRVDRIATGRTR